VTDWFQNFDDTKGTGTVAAAENIAILAAADPSTNRVVVDITVFERT
jgi:hypothetical protein